MPLSPELIEEYLGRAQSIHSPSQRSRILRTLLLEPESLSPKQRFIAESMEDEAALLESAGF